MKRKIQYLLCLLLSLSLLLSGCDKRPPNEHGDRSEESATESATDSEEPSETTDRKEEPMIPLSNQLQFTTDQEGIYNYCPSVMQLSDGTLYIYYCTNQHSYEVIDHVGCRKGVRNADGSVTWGEERIVLFPSAGAWDAHHVCDPSVIAGSFRYGGKTYGYLMAYLGCTSYDNQENKIGLAVASSPEGPFIKVGSEPLIDFAIDPDVTVFQWGVGQPSLVSADKNGKVYLFYTRGDKDGTRQMVDTWELSNLDAPSRIQTETLSARGLLNLNSEKDFMNNADFVYDTVEKRFYAVSDCHPNPTDTPNYISSHCRINSFAHHTSFTDFVWSKVKNIAPKDTGFPRNHNAGILRDAYGHLPDNGYLSVFYTVAQTGNDSLWSYRIYDYNIPLR